MSDEPGALSADLLALLKRGNASDVNLRGKDGESVPATRTVLAARSVVFEKMFLGDFSESTANDVPLEFSSSTLRAMVHYCHSDVLPEDLDEEVEDGSSSEEQTRELVKLVSAAHYFAIPKMRKAAIERLCCLMGKCQSLSCPVLDQSLKEETHEEMLINMAYNIVRYDPESALLPEKVSERGVSCMDSEVLTKVLGSSDIIESSIVRFNAIMRWKDSNADGAKRKRSAAGDCCSNEDKSTRQQKAKELISSIDLSEISPSRLVKDVEPSGLVSPEELHVAFKAHALKLETKLERIKEAISSDKDMLDAIIVTGAGISEANGIYRASGRNSRGGVKYSKKGMWMHKEVAYNVEKYVDPNIGNDLWWICIESKPKDFALYHIEVCSESIDSVYPDVERSMPVRTWKVCNLQYDHHKGVPPGPICIQYKGRSEN